MHYPVETPKLYLPNLESHLFLGGSASGQGQIKKLKKTKNFLEFDIRGGRLPTVKNTKFWLLIFTPLGPRGTPGALGLCQIKKLHITKSDKRLILGPCQPRLLLGPLAKNQKHAPQIF